MQYTYHSWDTLERSWKIGNHLDSLLFLMAYDIYGLVHKRHNSSALAMELRISCINPSIWKHFLLLWEENVPVYSLHKVNDAELSYFLSVSHSLLLNKHVSLPVRYHDICVMPLHWATLFSEKGQQWLPSWLLFCYTHWTLVCEKLLLCHPHTIVMVISIHPYRRQNVTSVNTLRLRQNGRHFPDDIFKRIFFNVNVWIPIEISWSLFLRVQ